jgi:hypothetical protein
MEGMVEELQYQVPFKETTEVGDLALMLRENDDGRVSMVYARVMGFDRDSSKRDEWWHVHFVFLEVPPLPRTIILQTPHFTGQEIFTMGGRKVFIKALNFAAFNDQGVLTDPPPSDRIGKKPPEGEPPSPPSPPGQRTASKPTFTLIK